MKLVDPNRGKQEAEAIVKKIEVFAKKQYAEVDADYEGNLSRTSKQPITNLR